MALIPILDGFAYAPHEFRWLWPLGVMITFATAWALCRAATRRGPAAIAVRHPIRAASIGIVAAVAVNVSNLGAIDEPGLQPVDPAASDLVARRAGIAVFLAPLPVRAAGSLARDGGGEMTVVLVHGAWHGAWTWDGVVRELADRDVDAIAVELPLTGFDDDVAATRAAIADAGTGAVVCGHSYGGFVISAAARDLDVARLVYLCAFMADEDDDVFGTWFAHPVPLHGARMVVDGRSTVDPAKAVECFYGDAAPDVAAAIVPRLRPMPAGGAPPDQTNPAWRSIPSTYVVCTRDQAIHPEVQRLMARHATDVVEWDADHSPFVSRPEIVAELLARLSR